MAQHKMSDWAFYTSVSSSSMVLRVFNQNGSVIGSKTVPVPVGATFAASLAWPGGWSDTYYGAEVVSITNGPVYAASVRTASIVDNTTGELLQADFNIGIVALVEASDPTI